ncbi:MAG: cold shock domain-containing protein [Pseudomonadota bacterium]
MSESEKQVELQIGRIKWFDENKSFGFILTNDGKEVFVHRKYVKNFKKYSLIEGDEVQFEMFKTDDGVQAKNVEKLGIATEEAARERKQAERYLANIMRRKSRLTFKLTGRRTINGLVNEVKSYDFVVALSREETIEVKKIETKCIYKYSNGGPISKLIKVDEMTRRKKLMPSEKIKDRYFIPNILLEETVKNSKEVTVTLSDGEVIKGPISWFTKYEMLIAVSPRLKVLVFRHSVVDFKVKFD